MATKKKAKKRTAKKTASRRGRAARSKVNLPHSIAEYVDEVQAMLDNLEREMAKAGTRTQREASRLMREASRQLGRVEKRGEELWREWTGRTRDEAVRLIDNLRGAIAPPAARKTRKRAV
jgi:ElaB/YqjD/DUF883 family membrane-anchored ribosome-binding protein